MADSYAKRILEYCERTGVVIPSGFHRHPASRYAVVDTSQSPPRLIAKTWFKQADLLYYVERHAEPALLKILDFKDGRQLVQDGKVFKATGQAL